MSTTPSAASRRRRLGRWALGSAIGGFHYVVRRVPMYRRDRTATPGDVPDLARAVPGDADTLQRAADGVGELYHRLYWIDVTDERLTPAELIARILRRPNDVTPTWMASFEDQDGTPAQALAVGDEIVVRLPGPWDGPVRVVEVTDTSFRLATLKGHLEAGEIEFRALIEGRGFLRFEIESWARSGDETFRLLYERFPIGRELQLHMWAEFCRRVAALADGVTMTNVAVTTSIHHDG